MGIYSIDLYKEESTEHLVFLLSDYIKEEHLRRCQKEKSKIHWERSWWLNARDLSYGKARRGQTGCLGLPNSQPS